jgi:hypothetical protein
VAHPALDAVGPVGEVDRAGDSAAGVAAAAVLVAVEVVVAVVVVADSGFVTRRKQ